MFWFETAPWPRGLIGLQNGSTAFPLIHFASVQLNPTSLLVTWPAQASAKTATSSLRQALFFSLFPVSWKLYASVKKRKTISQDTKASEKKTFLKSCSGFSRLKKRNNQHSQVTVCTGHPSSQSTLPSDLWLASPTDVKCHLNVVLFLGKTFSSFFQPKLPYTVVPSECRMGKVSI